MKRRLAATLAVLCAVPLLLASNSSRSDEVIIQREACPVGCTAKGNCNHEEGRCECPWGYTGGACEIDRMAVCKQTPDDPGSCGLVMPKNCECYRECFKLYCHYGSNLYKCVALWGPYLAACWLYGSSFEDAMRRPQLRSLYPEKPEKETVWFEKIPEYYGMSTYNHKMLLMDDKRRYKSPVHRPGLAWLRANHVAKPLSHCPDECNNGRGYCMVFDGESWPRCSCHMGFRGESCMQEEEPEEACWFSPNCSGRGVCRRGFCHCQPGYWGVGCHRSVAITPKVPGAMPDLRSPTKLKIYMYELPWDIAFPYDMNEYHLHAHDRMYTAYETFMKNFLTDTVVRTEDPYEASLFYVPALVFFYTGTIGNPQWQAEVAINYVRQKWPFYNRTGGRDHFIFMTTDRGSCEIERWLQDSVIKIVHFGMQQRGLNWTIPRFNQDYGCIQIKRDIVVPPRLFASSKLWPNATEHYYQTLLSTGGYDGDRNILLFFAGGVGNGEYSGGTRLAIRNLFRAIIDQSNLTMPEDVQFFEGDVGEEYVKLIRTSKFCLAPYGNGWGIRLMKSIHFGCIPVIIQDHVYQPFEDFLPYEEFSVRMRLSDVPHIIELLRGFSEEQLAALRLGMAKYYRAFIWEREFGGQAYEWTLAALQRRAYNLKGQYYDAVYDTDGPGFQRRLLRGM